MNLDSMEGLGRRYPSMKDLVADLKQPLQARPGQPLSLRQIAVALLLVAFSQWRAEPPGPASLAARGVVAPLPITLCMRPCHGSVPERSVRRRGLFQMIDHDDID
jgi:hypothetical protein